MGAVTVITSGKGGVGKSTVTAGLGGALARRGKRVLLMDMETGLRGLERMMGADELLVFDSADIVFGNCEPLRAVYPCPPFPGLFLLPAASTTEDALSENNHAPVNFCHCPLFRSHFNRFPGRCRHRFSCSSLCGGCCDGGCQSGSRSVCAAAAR